MKFLYENFDVFTSVFTIYFVLSIVYTPLFYWAASVWRIKITREMAQILVWQELFIVAGVIGHNWMGYINAAKQMAPNSNLYITALAALLFCAVSSYSSKLKWWGFIEKKS